MVGEAGNGREGQGLSELELSGVPSYVFGLPRSLRAPFLCACVLRSCAAREAGFSSRFVPLLSRRELGLPGLKKWLPSR